MSHNFEDVMDPVACIHLPQRDCASAGALIAVIADDLSRPYGRIHEFYKNGSCMPSSGTINPGRIVQAYHEWKWEGTGTDNRTIHDLIAFVGENCRTEFCQNLQFTGNPDFAGIGVLVAFITQLSVTTLFCGLYAYSLWNDISAVPEPLKKVFKVFIVSCLYFDIGLAIAVPITMVSTGNSEYTARLASLGFLAALASTVALWPFYEKFNMLENTSTAGPHWMKRCVGLGIVLTSSILLAMFAYSIPRHVDWENPFELYCFHRLNARPVAEMFPYVPMALVAIGLLVVLLKYIPPKTLINKIPGDMEKWLLPLISVLGFLIMWAAMAVLLCLRQEMLPLTGASYQEADWGFGQVLAVVAWLPTIGEAVRQLIKSW